MEEHYRKRYESALEGMQKLQRELDEARRENAQMLLEKLQWQAEKAKQQQIIAQALTQSNATSNGYLEENKKLKEEIQRLKG